MSNELLKNIGRKENGNLYLKSDIRIKSDRLPKELSGFSKWFYVFEQEITVMKNFEWNGCTWARDGKRNSDGIPESAIASCVHDALYSDSKLKISNKTKDLILYDELKKIDFKFLGINGAKMYYYGVRVFGNFFKS